MRLFDKPVEALPEETVVIPRQSGDLVFKAKAVLDYDEFDAICKRPTPPLRMLKGGEEKPVFDDPAFKKLMEEYAANRFNWMILKSLSATPGLFWDTVDMADPSTWGNYQTELASVLSIMQINAIISAVINACGLDEAKIQEATKSFLAGQAATVPMI
jgi:hypothetical protein